MPGKKPEGEGRMARAEIEARSPPNAAAALPQRRRSTGRRRAAKKPSLIRRVGLAVSVAPPHAPLALETRRGTRCLPPRTSGAVTAPLPPPLPALFLLPL